MNEKKEEEEKVNLCKDCFWCPNGICEHFIAKAYERKYCSECFWFKNK